MTAKFRTWSEDRDPEEVGIHVGKFKVSLAELQLIDSRSLAVEMGMSEDILDEYELTGQPWTRSRGPDLNSWVPNSHPVPIFSPVFFCNSPRGLATPHVCTSIDTQMYI